jgi:hypothetical protein
MYGSYVSKYDFTSTTFSNIILRGNNYSSIITFEYHYHPSLLSLDLGT